MKNIDNAMILAAGLGTRMRPLTNSTPKPLISVSGKTLLDHNLDCAARSGVTKAVVNVHYLADQMERHLSTRNQPEIQISDEREQLMETGGGIAKALPLLGNDPFFVMNTDTFWIEGYKPNLLRMRDYWDAERMDMLLLLSDTISAIGYHGTGDFQMGPRGRLIRRQEKNLAPFAFTGAYIVNPAIMKDVPTGSFSANILFDRAIERDRLFGLRLDGVWLHVGTPQGLADAENVLAQSAA